MSETAVLYKNLEGLNRSDIRIVSNYVKRILNDKNNRRTHKPKMVDLSKYQLVGKRTNVNAAKYIKEMRNEW